MFQALDSSSESARGIARTVLESDGYGEVQLEPPPRVQPPAGPDQLRPVSMMVHGTWAYDERGWRPGVGDFHQYIKDKVRPNLWARPSVYYWSGRYEPSDRDWAIYDLLSWAGQHCPRGVDTVFAHSYGGHVAMRAVAAGLRPRTLVFLSTPFYADDLPSLSAVQGSCKVVSFRTKRDLVLFADKVTRFVKNLLGPSLLDHLLAKPRLAGSLLGIQQLTIPAPGGRRASRRLYSCLSRTSSSAAVGALGMWQGSLLDAHLAGGFQGGGQGPTGLPISHSWPERIDDPAQTPAVLIANGGLLGSAGVDRPPHHRVGIIGHQQGPARRAADRARAEPPAARPGRCHPECRLADGQLRDDVIALSYAVQDARPERVRVERDGLASTLDPQLRLDTRHPPTVAAHGGQRRADTAAGRIVRSVRGRSEPPCRGCRPRTSPTRSPISSPGPGTSRSTRC